MINYKDLTNKEKEEVNDYLKNHGETKNLEGIANESLRLFRTKKELLRWTLEDYDKNFLIDMIIELYKDAHNYKGYHKETDSGILIYDFYQ